MIKLTSLNILGQLNDILDLKKGLVKTLKNISAVREDLLRIAWKCMIESRKLLTLKLNFQQVKFGL